MVISSDMSTDGPEYPRRTAAEPAEAPRKVETGRDQCVLCGKPHSTPGNYGTSRRVGEVWSIFLEGLDATLPKQLHDQELWYCTKCEPRFQELEALYLDFKEAQKPFNDARERIAKLVVDSAQALGILEGSYNTYSAFVSVRTQIYSSWDRRLKQKIRSQKISETMSKHAPDPVPSTPTPTPEQRQSQTSLTSQNRQNGAFPRSSSVPTSGADTILTGLTQKPRPSTPAPAASERIVLRINRGRITTQSQPSLIPTREEESLEPSTAVDLDPLSNENSEDNDLSSLSIVAVESLADKPKPKAVVSGRRTLAGSRTSLELEFGPHRLAKAGSRSDLPLPKGNGNGGLAPLRRASSLTDLNIIASRRSASISSTKIDARAAALAARAVPSPPTTTCVSPSPAAAAPHTNVHTTGGSSVRIIFDPAKVAKAGSSLSVKRDSMTGDIRQLFTSDKNYLDAHIDDSKEGILVITPKNGGQAKTFRYTQKLPKPKRSGSVPNAIVSSGTAGSLDTPKSPSPPTLERMDTTNGTPVPITSGRRAAAAAPTSSANRAGANSGTPATAENAEKVSPPALDSSDSTTPQDEVNEPQLRTSGRSGRQIKRPLNFQGQQWMSEGEIDKLIGAEASQAKRSRSRTPKTSDEKAGSVRARRSSSKQRQAEQNNEPVVEENKESGEAAGTGRVDTEADPEGGNPENNSVNAGDVTLETPKQTVDKAEVAEAPEISKD